jgi:glycine cleavage system aminomethyltransferase T
LGQETIGDIGALGHADRLLIALKVDPGCIPEPSAELVADGRLMGRITSPVRSPRFAAPLALAFA